MLNRTLIMALAAAAISTPAVVAPAIFTPAAAQVGVSINIGVPPPAPIFEPVPAPRVGYVWAPGYWGWENGRHMWHGGYWMHERPGYSWTADRWVHEGGGWRREPGHWDHQVAEHHGYEHEHWH